MRIKADSEPSLVCRSRQKVCIAVNDHVAATYSLTMYSLKERSEAGGGVGRSYVLGYRGSCGRS